MVVGQFLLQRFPLVSFARFLRSGDGVFQLLRFFGDGVAVLRLYLGARLGVLGIEVGLLVSLICRPTRREALAAAEKLLEEVGGRPRRTHEEFAKRSDSVAFTSTYALAAKDQWLNDYLWSGAVPFLGAPTMAIVGSSDDVTDALFDLRAAGITQFLFMGWPDMEEMTNFHRDVLPLVRHREQREEARAV